VQSGGSPRVTSPRGASPNAHQGFEGCDLECPLGEMKIIGPRAIVGHRRQTRIERLHSVGSEGWRRRLPFGNYKTGDVGRPSFGSDRLRNAKGRRPVLEHPRERELHSRRGLAGTGFGWHRNQDPLANPGITQNRHGKRDLPEKLETSTRPRALNGARRHPSSVPPTLSAPAARNGARRTPQSKRTYVSIRRLQSSSWRYCAPSVLRWARAR
jgi:hypothetical protein